MAANGIIKEVDMNLFASTEYSRLLTVPQYEDGLNFTFETITRFAYKTPEYLAFNSYANPSSVDKCPFHLSFDTPLNLWQFMDSKPELLRQFHSYITVHTATSWRWFEPGVYDVSRLLADYEGRSNQDGDTKLPIFLVDVGGGVGTDLVAFLRHHPSMRNEVVLQDTEGAIAEARKGGMQELGIQTMVHDFFYEQPVKGAQIYYIHSVLHNWPDDKCHEILKHLRDAMTRRFSRIIIDDTVIAERNADMLETGSDLLMMASCGGKERSKNQWTELVESVQGLKVERVVKYPGAGIVECILT